ncbi:hypothetical protein JW935_06115 [candidate division KSB1 bacterium]|nr:hypothetical protein [candidate division KSB1 bacterium]
MNELFEKLQHLDLLIPVMLYAETHYKFPFIPSRLWKKEPEIIADVPHRLEPDADLPVLLLVKDAHLYPVKLIEVTAILINKTQRYILLQHTFQHFTLETAYWDKIFALKVPQNISGETYVDVRIKYAIKNKIKTVHNDNYRISEHRPFRVFIDPDPLPGTEECRFGDLHYHSHYTNDQVEFGASLPATVEIAKAMGLSFFAVTDHSYDLDDTVDNYLKNDPQHPKWHRMHRRVEGINKNEKTFVIIPGEELSVGNHKNKNVHILIFNEKKFFPGSGDGAERWFKTQPELSIKNTLNLLSSKALVFAAHPEIKPPLLQQLLIRRGKWSVEDYQHKRLDGLQVWNSEKDRYFSQGIKKWILLLLGNYRLSIIAGNDAHGNFGRFRQIGFPFFTLRENNKEIFAKARTGILKIPGVESNNLLKLLKEGRTIITDGPFGRLQLTGESKRIYILGDICRESIQNVQIKALSTQLFGWLAKIKLYIGDIENRIERMVEIDASGNKTETQIENLPFPRKGYIRMDIFTETKCRCLTNPIYIDRSSKV